MSKKIIVAEDDAGTRFTIQMLLEKQGYSVTVYPDTRLIMDNDFAVPDLFILDKQLPGIGGLEACRFLKGQQATKHIPVIIFSANPHVLQLATSEGADDFLEKPFTISQLRQLVEKYIGPVE